MERTQRPERLSPFATLRLQREEIFTLEAQSRKEKARRLAPNPQSHCVGWEGQFLAARKPAASASATVLNLTWFFSETLL